MAQLLRAQLKAARIRWEKKQRAIELARGAVPDAGSIPTGQFRVTLCSSGFFGDLFFRSLERLVLDGRLWSIIDLGHYTDMLSCEVFMILSRQGSLTGWLIAGPHARHPYRVFRLLHDPCFVQELMNDPECSLGPCMHTFRADNDLTEPAPLLLAKMARFLISGVEALHATVRRLVLSRVQTHRLDLPRVSSEWVQQRFRTQYQ